ncbi:polyketide synthase [Tistrella bauzanensis]|uniref:Polyketide synthase n=1 Tax=Tistrella bauzanensis TaxID=657419 RepID=A0ABQ1IWZ0_9PROT|nr:type I polyketide synthase [Tistrella bauzanensis]GGB53277.1 polyketide synthase [Tistrella bauzanensis]
MMQGSDQLNKAFRVIQHLEAEVAALRGARAPADALAEPVAIVGMACRMPGVAGDDGDGGGLDGFWSLLSQGRDAVVEVPPERWDIDALYDPDPDRPGRMSTRRGGFISGVDRFDAGFFNIAPREAALMDPQQRLLLELSWHALEHAAIAPDSLQGTPAGVFVGICASDYGRMAAADADNLNAYWGTGNVPSVAAGRIAYSFGLTGPCMSIDTACSSALVAVHCAADSLRRGECDAALAASANLVLAPEPTIAFSKAHMMSPDGRCQTFDARANGYVRSEGAAVLVLKTLSRARADGDRVWAVIRGSAVNQDGASGGLTVPNGPSQVALIRQALANAGLAPDQIGYIEAHGTGTALGDPIEVGALGQVFGQSHSADRPLYLGSVKTLVGHLEVAAGMAGLIKLVLSLNHGIIPGYPQLGDLSPHIPWAALPFNVVREPMPWPRGPRIAGISGFGFSGTNAHLIVEAPEAVTPEKTGEAAPAQPAHLVLLSARGDAALTALAARHAAHLRAHPDLPLDALSATLATGRDHLPHRLAVTATDMAGLAMALERAADGGAAGRRGQAPASAPRLGLLFSGQGAQYPGMGRRLYDLHPVFRAAIDRAAAILAPLIGADLRDLLWGDPGHRLSETGFTQPALFALEYALARLWLSWGLRPAFVAGHSVGEFAAACIAGVFSLDDGLRLIAARGRLMQALPDGGAMAVVPAGAAQVAPAVAAIVERMGDVVAIAGINAPDQTVISGARDAVLAVCARMKADYGVADRGLLDVSHAFHSPLMRPMLDDFRAVARSVTYARPSIGIVSGLTGRVAGDEIRDPEYWVRHVLAPVRFMDAVACMAGHGVGAWLEIGPRATLTGLARACLDTPAPPLTVASLAADGDDWLRMLDALARLHLGGVALDWRRAGRLDQPLPRRLALPVYPFQRNRYWLPEPKAGGGVIAAAAARDGETGHHPLLGQPLINAAQPAGDRLYQAVLSTGRSRLLADHRVYDRVVVPGAAYVDMALAAGGSAAGGAASGGRGRPALRNLSIQAAMVLAADRPQVVQTVIGARDDGGGSGFRIFSTAATDGGAEADAAWALHAAGDIVTGDHNQDAPQPVDLAGLRRRFAAGGHAMTADDFYGRYAAMGLQYGPAFRSVRQVFRMSDAADPEPPVLESLAEVAVDPAAMAGHVVHPALLDGCFQALGAVFADLGMGPAWLPVGIEAVRVLHAVPAMVWSHAVLRPRRQDGDPRAVADLRLIDPDGRVVVVVDGLQAVPVDRRALAFVTAGWKDKVYVPGWVPQPHPEPQPAADPTAPDPAAGDGGWLVLADRGGAGARLAAALAAGGRRVVVIGPDDLAGAVDDPAAWMRLIAGRIDAEGMALAGILHLWALDVTDSDDPAARAAAARLICGSTLGLVKALAAMPDRRLPRLWLITAGSQMVADSGPAGMMQAMLWGFGRSIALEHPALDCTCIDLPPHETRLDDDLVAGILADLLAPATEPQLAWRQGQRHVARLSRAVSLQGRPALTLPPVGADQGFRLRATGYGAFDRLRLLPAARVAPADDAVEIEVRAAAVNFKDVLYALGMLTAFSEAAGIMTAPDQPLGFECAGRVVRLGAAVRGLAVGDAVFAMAPSAMASHVTVDRRLVHRMPAGHRMSGELSFAEAAALPTVFMTAIYSLERLAGIRPGDRVLIHACAGGVGQAAIQIARRAGAIVYGTASPAKWPVLKAQGVAHVMHSRTLDFADEIMAVTEGRGVDIVINSLTGAVIEKSADVLAPGGRFIEIGKIGIWSAERMAAYRPDISYAAFDLGEIDETGGGLQAELLGDVVRGLEAGHLRPLPVRGFPITRAEAAFRHLAQARNIGKVVLTMPDADAEAAAGGAGPIRADRSYLVTGGLGSLGRAIARRLVEDGARHVVLAGRHADDDAAAALIARFADTGADIRVWPLDVTDRAAVDAVLARMGRELAPPGGIIHAAGVLDDGVITRQDMDRFARVLAPKVDGAWTLHRASEAWAAAGGPALDVFVLFSSIASVTGAPGQANYAAANAAMDALARLRQAQGLPVTCINWGPWDADKGATDGATDGGMAARTQAANHARFAALGLGRMPAAHNLDVFSHLLTADLPVAMVADINWPRFRRGLPSAAAGATFALVDRQAVASGGAATGALFDRLKAAAPADRERLLIAALRAEVAIVVGLPAPDDIGLDQPLLKLGIDSLMAVELKNRIEAGLRCTLNPTLLFDHPTLQALGRHLAGAVLGLTGEAAVAAVPAGSDNRSSDDDGDSGRAMEAGMIEAGMIEGAVIDGGGPRLGLCRWAAATGAARAPAPLIICVHGILDQGAIWGPVAARLAAAGHEVVAPDLRGHGVSDHAPAGVLPTVFDFVADLARVVRQVVDLSGEGRPYVLVGHSIGSLAAALYAAHAPDGLAHLVLVEPVTPALRDGRPVVERLATDLRYLTEAPAHPVYPDIATAARMLGLNHPHLDAALALALARRVTRPVAGGVSWIWDTRLRNPLGADPGLSCQGYLDLLAGLRVPSTRIHGAESRFAGTPVLLDPDLNLPGSRSLTIAGSHNLHTDAPDLVRDLILAAIDTQAG